MIYHTIWQIALIIFAIKIAGDVSVRLGQPAVLGKLIIGMLLGPAVLGIVDHSDLIEFMAEIGVLLLMFLAGLETDLKTMKENWLAALAVAVGGVILPFIGTYGIVVAFGFDQTHALFFSTLFCATSVSISVQVLKELNRLNSREGAAILGAAVVDDVLVVLLLAVIMSIMGAGTDISIGMTIGLKVLFFAVVIVAGWWLVPRVMKWLSRLKITEPVASIALVIGLAFAWFADETGMAGIIGSFAAGLAISRTNFRHTVEEKLNPVAYTFFVPIFFFSIGLNVTFEGLGEQIWFALALTVMAILTKLVGCGLGARLTGFNNRSSIAIGAAMISRGEVALIIASIGLSSGLLHSDYFTSAVLVVVATTLVTPPLLKWLFGKRETEPDNA
jgi:monovalent cation:proton antiporter-2 (CPA2) family protein